MEDRQTSNLETLVGNTTTALGGTSEATETTEFPETIETAEGTEIIETAETTKATETTESPESPETPPYNHDFQINHSYDTTFLQQLHTLHSCTFPVALFKSLPPTQLPAIDDIAAYLLRAKNAYMKASDPWQGNDPKVMTPFVFHDPKDPNEGEKAVQKDQEDEETEQGEIHPSDTEQGNQLIKEQDHSNQVNQLTKEQDDSKQVNECTKEQEEGQGQDGEQVKGTETDVITKDDYDLPPQPEPLDLDSQIANQTASIEEAQSELEVELKKEEPTTTVDQSSDVDPSNEDLTPPKFDPDKYTPTQTYKTQFLALFENEKTLADLIISTQYLNTMLYTLRSRIARADGTFGILADSFASQTVIDLGVITLTHFLILNEAVETSGLDVLNFAATITATLTPESNCVACRYTDQTPLFARSLPSISHLNPFSRTPVKDQMDKLNQSHPNLTKPGVVTHSTMSNGSLSVSTPSTPMTKDTTRLDVIPYHHRGKIFKFIEKMAWESTNGYGFTRGINYLGYGDILSQNSNLGPITTTDHPYLGRKPLKSLAIDSSKTLDLFYESKQRSYENIIAAQGLQQVETKIDSKMTNDENNLILQLSASPEPVGDENMKSSEPSSKTTIDVVDQSTKSEKTDTESENTQGSEQPTEKTQTESANTRTESENTPYPEQSHETTPNTPPEIKRQPFTSPIPANLITYSLFPYTVPLSTLPKDPVTGKIPLCALPTAFLTMFDLLAQCMFEVWWIITNALSGSAEDNATLYGAGVSDLIALYLLTPNLPHGVVDQVLWAISNYLGDGAGQISDLTSLIPLDLILKQRLQSLIQFPFCLEAPRLSLLQGSGISSLSIALFPIINILRAPPPSMRRTELINYITLGKICIRILLYVDWFEHTIRSCPDKYDILTIDPIDFQTDLDPYHRVLSKQSKPFGLNGINGKPLAIDVYSPSNNNAVEGLKDDIFFFQYVSRLENAASSEAFRSVFSSDLISLLVSTAIAKRYSVTPIIRALTELSLNDGSELLSPHQPLPFLGQHILHHAPTNVAEHVIINCKHILWSISNLTASSSSQLSTFSLVATGIPAYIQSVVYAIYHTIAAGMSALTVEPFPQSNGLKVRGQYRHYSLANHSVDKFNLDYRALQSFHTRTSFRHQDHHIFESISRLIHEATFIICNYWEPGLHTRIGLLSYDAPTQNPTTFKSFATLHLATHYSFAAIFYQLISTLDWSQYWVSERQTTGSSLAQICAVYLNDLQKLLTTPFFRLGEDEDKDDPVLDRSPLVIQKNPSDDLEPACPNTQLIRDGDSDGDDKTETKPDDSDEDKTKTNTDIAPVLDETGPSDGHIGGFEKNDDNNKLSDLPQTDGVNEVGGFCFSLAQPGPKRNLVKRLPPQLIKSTYIIYIETLSRMLQGFANSAFHTSSRNGERSGVGSTRSNARFSERPQSDNVCKGSIYCLESQAVKVDEYEVNAKRLANPKHQNPHYLLHLPTGQYDGEPIPYGYDRMTSMVQHCIELFIDMLLEPNQFKLIQTIEFEVPDEKLPVYLEDFLSPYEKDVIDIPLFNCDYGYGMFDKDETTLDLSPIFDNFKQHNRGHLIKAIPPYVWDWIYKEDQPKSSLSNPKSALASLISTRRRRILALAYSFPSRYMTISHSTSPTPGVFTYTDQFESAYKSQIDADGMISPPQNPLLSTIYRNFKFRPHYPYQPLNQRDYQYLLSRLDDEDYNKIKFPLRQRDRANRTDTSPTADAKSVTLDSDAKDDAKDDDDEDDDDEDDDYSDDSDEEYGDSGENDTIEFTCELPDSIRLNRADFPPLKSSAPLAPTSVPFSPQYPRILSNPPRKAPTGKNNLTVPTHAHMPFFYLQTDEELDLVHEAFSSNRLFDVITNASSYQKWHTKFQNRPLVNAKNNSAAPGSNFESKIETNHETNQIGIEFKTGGETKSETGSENNNATSPTTTTTTTTTTDDVPVLLAEGITVEPTVATKLVESTPTAALEQTTLEFTTAAQETVTAPQTTLTRTTEELTSTTTTAETEQATAVITEESTTMSKEPISNIEESTPTKEQSPETTSETALTTAEESAPTTDRTTPLEQQPSLQLPSPTIPLSKSLIHLLPHNHTFSSLFNPGEPIRLDLDMVQNTRGQNSCFLDLELLSYNINEYDHYGLRSVKRVPGNDDGGDDDEYYDDEDHDDFTPFITPVHPTDLVLDAFENIAADERRSLTSLPTLKRFIDIIKTGSKNDYLAKLIPDLSLLSQSDRRLGGQLITMDNGESELFQEYLTLVPHAGAAINRLLLHSNIIDLYEDPDMYTLESQFIVRRNRRFLDLSHLPQHQTILTPLSTMLSPSMAVGTFLTFSTIVNGVLSLTRLIGKHIHLSETFLLDHSEHLPSSY